MAGGNCRSGRVSLPAETSDPAAAIPQPLDCAIARACEEVTHNLSGQKLGRKGRFTRERIIRAAIDILEGSSEEPFTLSAVARRANLRMSSIYNYFNDLSELMIAVLEPVMASADVIFIELIREYWPDEDLGEWCVRFWRAYTRFWHSHAALLHQRNRMSDAGDERMLRHRVEAVQPLLDHIHMQLGLGDGGKPDAQARAMAAVLLTGIERSVTVQTHPNYRRIGDVDQADVGDFTESGARLLQLAIMDNRQRLRRRIN